MVAHGNDLLTKPVDAATTLTVADVTVAGASKGAGCRRQGDRVKDADDQEAARTQWAAALMWSDDDSADGTDRGGDVLKASLESGQAEEKASRDSGQGADRGTPSSERALLQKEGDEEVERRGASPYQVWHISCVHG